MVATVISADMDLVGQSSPGTLTSFTSVSLDEALAARAAARAAQAQVDRDVVVKSGCRG